MKRPCASVGPARVRGATVRWALAAGVVVSIWFVHAVLAAALARADLLAGVLVGRAELVLAALLLMAVRGALLFVVPGVLLYFSGALVLAVCRERCERRASAAGS